MAANNRSATLAELKRFRAQLDDLPEELRFPEPGTPPGRILRATREVLGVSGIEGLTTRAVAEVAGVNQAMINYYFGSKEKLIETVIRGAILDILRSALDALLSWGDPERILPRHPVTIFGTLRRDPRQLSLMREVAATDPRRLENAAAGLGNYGILGIKRIVVRLIGELQKTGTVPEVPPDHLLLFLVSLVFGLVLLGPVAESIFNADLADDTQWEEISGSIVKILEAGLSGPSLREA